MKKLVSLVGVILLSAVVTNVKAAEITWTPDQDQFRYSVDVNGGEVFQPPTSYNPNASGPVDIKTNLAGGTDPITSVAYSSYADSVVDMQLYAGAQGGLLDNGSHASVYSQANFGLVTGTEAEGASVEQRVKSFVARNLTVDMPGYYNLDASAGGAINFASFGSSADDYHAYFTYDGGVDLYEMKPDDGGLLTLNTWSLSIDQIWSGQDTIADILLRPFDDEGDPVYYMLSVGFGEVLTHMTNLDMGKYPNAVTGDLGSVYEMGTFDEPLVLEGTLSPVPVPGSFLLLFSGIGGLCSVRFAVRRLRDSYTTL